MKLGSSGAQQSLDKLNNIPRSSIDLPVKNCCKHPWLESWTTQLTPQIKQK